MNSAIIKKFKLYFVWNDDTAEEWLQQMAREGLHLKSVNSICHHTFVRGAPADVAYRIDYQYAGRDPHREQLFKDAGWEMVQEIAGWQYWRKKVVPGVPMEIFSDNASRMQKYQRMLLLLGAILLLQMPIVLNPSLHAYFENAPAIRTAIPAILIGASFSLLVYAVIRLSMRIRQLKA